MSSIPSKKPTGAYKAIPDPVVGDDSLYHAVVAIKEVVEVLTRQRKPFLSAAVTFQDLKDLGIVDGDGRALQDIGTLLNWLSTAKPILDDAWGAWIAYTPTISATAGTITDASATGRYKYVGKTVFVQMDITITTNGTGAGNIKATLPLGLTASQNQSLAVVRTSAAITLCGAVAAAGNDYAIIGLYDDTYPGADGTTFVLSGIFEVA